MQQIWKMQAVGYLSLMLVSAGCQSVPIEQLPANADPSAEISKLEAGRDAALAEQADVLAPDSFQEVSEHLTEAKRLRTKNASNEAILESVAGGLAYLKKAEATTKAAQEVMPEVLNARRAALTAHAPQFDRKGLEKADKNLRKVGKDLEDQDKASALKKRLELQKEFAAVEANSLHSSVTGPAKHTRDQALREGAQKFASRTLADLDAKLKEADSYVTVNLKDKAALERMEGNLLKSADRLLRITRESKALNADDGEAIALQREAQNERLASERAALKEKQTELEETTSELKQTERTAAQLAASKAFQDKVKAAQHQFSSTEAQVLQQAGKVIIRLTDLRFATGQHGPNSSRFGMLNRVSEVIDTFAPAEVVIQGHSDATGNAQANKDLSLARAEAVKDYLQAQRTSTDGKPLTLRAEGLGDQQPIASNKTASGRAKNRRVDVIIVPQSLPAVAH